jgi:hypothetical protein
MNFKRRLEKLESVIKIKVDSKPVNCIILTGFQNDDSISGIIFWHRYKKNLEGTEFSGEEELEALIKENNETANTML